MNKNKQLTKIYLMQSICLTNYAKLCIKLKEVPRISVIEMLANCEDLEKLMDSNKLFAAHLK